MRHFNISIFSWKYHDFILNLSFYKPLISGPKAPLQTKHRPCKGLELRISSSFWFPVFRSVRLTVHRCHVFPASLPRGHRSGGAGAARQQQSTRVDSRAVSGGSRWWGPRWDPQRLKEVLEEPPCVYTLRAMTSPSRCLYMIFSRLLQVCEDGDLGELRLTKVHHRSNIQSDFSPLFLRQTGIFASLLFGIS